MPPLESNPEVIPEPTPETPPIEIIPAESTPTPTPTEQSAPALVPDLVPTPTPIPPSEPAPTSPIITPSITTSTNPPPVTTSTTPPSEEVVPPPTTESSTTSIFPPPPHQPLLTSLSTLLATARGIIQKHRNEKLEKIMELALKQRGKGKTITNDDVEKLLRVSDKTSTRYLNILTKQGRLKKSGQKKGVVYEVAG